MISNYNSFEAIQLCIESIRAKTDYPNYQIIVHDDESSNNVDIKYLEEAEAKGWIQLIRGNNRKRWGNDFESFSPLGHPAPYWHGCALNVLINESCHTDLAMLLDCDIFIKESDWLSRMVEFIDDDILVVAYFVNARAHVGWPTGRGGSQVFYVPGWYRPSFCMINMIPYRDGMQVDWRGGSADIRDEPYKTLLGMLKKERKDKELEETCIAFDPGSSLWIKMQIDNPKQYAAKPLPIDMELKFHHFKQISVRSAGLVVEKAMSQNKLELMRSELAKLRGAI
jgi:glycosyltransferase involved in cell wall biosynthesis